MYFCFWLSLGLLFCDGIHGESLIPMLQPLSDKMIHYINYEANTTWKAKKQSRFPNIWSIRRSLGTLPTPKRLRLDTYCLTSTIFEPPIPEYFDAREKWPECTSISEIRDQSSCGSCWVCHFHSKQSLRTCIACMYVHLCESVDVSALLVYIFLRVFLWFIE
ncbi:hypothetical protein P879_00811 [Paragonimus westermani]|uniref:Peptidase C1A papain C-terminal domain-containing protein n=1 Tax=Paragonimus westermani TaxID=34504 RepID=A0A8T0DZY6_9TREM|nr:hypothetical protein P879_00811 [Paragonimus westermani]